MARCFNTASPCKGDIHYMLPPTIRLPNFPDNPDLAIAAGTNLCENVFEPIQDRLVESAFVL